MARIAKAVYGRYNEIFDQVAWLGGNGLKFFERGDTRAVGFILDGHACVVFRGTATAGDWWTDAKFFYTGIPRRHLGFVQAWHRIKDEVTDWLTLQRASGHRVVLAGHSLGAAIAILAAFDYAPAFDIGAVITFGSPRVGSWAFRQAYQARRSGSAPNAPALGEITWRFIEGGDVVTILPPPLLYFHVGRTAGRKPFDPYRPLDLVIQDETWLDAWGRRLDSANAKWRTFPPEPINLRNGIKALTLILVLAGLFVPVSATLQAHHRCWSLAINLFLTVPGLMIVRAVLISFLDHKCENYCSQFGATRVSQETK